MPARDIDEVVIPRPVVLRTAVEATRRSIVRERNQTVTIDRTFTRDSLVVWHRMNE
jgi:hypothetical protein